MGGHACENDHLAGMIEGDGYHYNVILTTFLRQNHSLCGILTLLEFGGALVRMVDDLERFKFVRGETSGE